MTGEESFYISVKDFIESDGTPVLSEEEKVAQEKLYTEMKVEATRVLKMFTSKWTPAYIGMKPVRCLYNYPINMNIE